jgi:hypothetical protein
LLDPLTRCEEDRLRGLANCEDVHVVSLLRLNH